MNAQLPAEHTALRVACDQLTAVGSTSIAYDAIGNPTTYNGYDLTWDGRQLKKMQKSGLVMEFCYNADGIRTSKTIGGIEHVYTLNGTQIVSEAWGNYLLIYLYDESGSPIGMQYRETSYAADVYDTFYFEKNLQGDIIAVYNENGVKIVSYNYDAWGNHTPTWHNLSGSNILAAYNPFRYRGYYYDIDTSLYYLQSRYYNPAWGRFLNVDAYISTGTGLIGYNMYAYCGNNPVMFVDYSGMCPGCSCPACMSGLPDECTSQSHRYHDQFSPPETPYDPNAGRVIPVPESAHDDNVSTDFPSATVFSVINNIFTAASGITDVTACTTLGACFALPMFALSTRSYAEDPNLTTGQKIFMIGMNFYHTVGGVAITYAVGVGTASMTAGTGVIIGFGVGTLYTMVTAFYEDRAVAIMYYLNERRSDS